MFLETRLGHRLKLGDASGAHSASGGDPMDVGSFSKGGKRGKGKKGKGDCKKGSPKGKSGKGSGQTDNKGKGSGSGSKETRVCHNCNKIGHLKKDCWAAGGGAANPRPRQSQVANRRVLETLKKSLKPNLWTLGSSALPCWRNGARTTSRWRRMLNRAVLQLL